jgi:hypothetical protein
LLIITGLFVLIAVMVYGTQDGLDVDFLGWAFWVSAVGGAGHIANAIITFILDCLSCC